MEKIEIKNTFQRKRKLSHAFYFLQGIQVLKPQSDILNTNNTQHKHLLNNPSAGPAFKALDFAT